MGMGSISTRFTLLRRRIQPSFTHVLQSTHDDDHNPSSLPYNNHFINPNAAVAGAGASALFGRRRMRSHSLSGSAWCGVGSSSYSYSSSAINQGGGGGGFELEDKATVVDQVAQALSGGQTEVAIAVTDSYLPVKALQYLIDYIHTFSGLNWWAAIALTTLLIRGATVPILIYNLKATSKLALIKPQMEEIKQQMDMAMDPVAVSDGQKRIKTLFKEHGVSPFTPLKGLFIQAPVFISFYLAINNMVEKVPSFKGGGVFWFTDLTTPDSLYIFPVLTSLTFLITVECNLQEGMEGNAAAATMKNFSRILAFLTIPFTMNFPKAIFCYWITSNFFSLMYGLVIKRPQVKKYLRLPDIPRAAAGTAQQSSFSLFPAFKGVAPVKKDPSPLPTEPLKILDRKPTSVLSQRIRNLEKKVKGKKKNKRR